MDYVINVRGLNKHFGDKHVVKDVSITIGKSRIMGFLGPNGSGKTTTLRLLCGLLTPDSGQGEVLGMNFRTQSDKIKLKTGYMTQTFSLYEDMTIAENLQFVARVYGLNNRKQRVETALMRLGLLDRQKQLAGSLSGGWKQRLALAAATIHEPELLLLDEPTAGVDPKARREFWDEIHAMSAAGLTVMVSTHYMDEAERCHDIGYILYGRLITRGTAKEIIEKSGLVTFNGTGAGIDKIAGELIGKRGVLSASAFGAAIHVSGLEREALEQAIKPYGKFSWNEVPPSLEDVFIQLMGRKADDRYIQ
jgi:ABC-2 type transport system ATP-binding protein